MHFSGSIVIAYGLATRAFVELRFMASADTPKRSRCTGSDVSSRGAVHLPVLEGEHSPSSTIRRSKSGKRRAIVLAIVQVLIIAHVIQWYITGKTSTPIEPSEAMAFGREGVINAGLIFFVLALLSTLVLGRWFCGWGCHLVMLQDLCGWIMKKFGVRPKAFRSRLLLYVPLILGLYMFLWPAFYRLGVLPNWQKLANAFNAIPPPTPLPDWPGFSVHLATTEFWTTFPSVFVTIPFLFICGFATVYFLGAKGFCTYGCPYGGFFAPLDEFAPARIRVTDACEQCGHCTAVCTSNVRVHEEVAAYGMVVDPGCMKCLDCVSVCPNDALYFGFGRPAVTKGRPKRDAPKRLYDLTMPQELALAVVFLFTFLAVRGIYGLIPMLMAAGIAGIVTFLIWKLWQIVAEPNVRLHKFQFKYKGKIKLAGSVFAGSVALVMLLIIHSAVVMSFFRFGTYHDRQVTIPQEVIFSGHPVRMNATMTQHTDRALRLYSRCSQLGEGGIGLSGAWQGEIDMRRARLFAAKLQFDDAEKVLRHALDRDGRSESFCRSLAWVMRAQLRIDEAIAYYTQILTEELAYNDMLGDFVVLCRQEVLFAEAIDVCRKRLERQPEHLRTMRWLSLLLIDSDRVQEGVDLIRQTLLIDPDNASAYSALASALMTLGQHDQAYQSILKAIELAPRDFRLHLQIAELLETLGRSEEAAAHHDRAHELQPNVPGDHR